MSNDNPTLCYGCMSPLEDGRDLCPRCGYSNRTPGDPNYLLPGSLLANRYLVGRVLTMDGEGVQYIGFDQERKCKVWIREFFPQGLSSRNQEDATVRPLAGEEIRYKALLADFEDLQKTLFLVQDLGNIIPLLDTFRANGTAYGVLEYRTVITLGGLINRSGGDLTWSQTKKMFLPLLNTVAALHRHKVIHRGISPETVLVDQEGRLWLSGFATAALRTDQSEIPPQLFPGYSAPEQYGSGASWQGPWTDVYALAAVCYRAITGTRPPEALSRGGEDNLLPAQELNAAIPDNVSQALSRALQLGVEKRTPSVENLTSQLLEVASSNTTVYSMPNKGSGTVPLVQEPEQSAAESGQQEQKKRNMVAFGITVGVAAAILVAFVVWFVVFKLDDFRAVGASVSSSSSQQSTSSEPSTSSESSSEPENNQVRNFVGLEYTSVINNPDYQEQYNFIVEREHSNEVSEGRIISQDPPQYSTVAAVSGKITVTLKVSSGPDLVEIPTGIIGTDVQSALSTLRGLGITCKESPRNNLSTEPGTVGEIWISNSSGLRQVYEGDSVNLSTDQVFLYYAMESSSSSQSAAE